MINDLSKGYLKFPSDRLFDLLSAIEKAILKTVGGSELNCYSFLQIINNVFAENITFVGCPDHRECLTKKVINYYVLNRAQILSKVYNKMYNEKRKKEQELRKSAKLVVGGSNIQVRKPLKKLKPS